MSADFSSNPDVVAKNALTAQHIGEMNSNNDRVIGNSRHRRSTVDPELAAVNDEVKRFMDTQFNENRRAYLEDNLRKRYLAGREDLLAAGDVEAALALDAEYGRESRKITGEAERKKIGGVE